MSNWLITANGPMPVKTDGLDVTEQARRLLIEAGWTPPEDTWVAFLDAEEARGAYA